MEEYDPDVNDLLFVHAAALVKQYGGSSGVRAAGALEAAGARPWGASFGREYFPTPFDKAAAICEAVIKRHPFADGNKRTGIAAGVYLLSTVGHLVTAERGDLQELAISMATGKLALEEMPGGSRIMAERGRSVGTFARQVDKGDSAPGCPRACRGSLRASRSTPIRGPPPSFGRYCDGEPSHREDGTETHCFQCMSCRCYVPLEGELGSDWGACTNSASEYDGRCVFEHWTCKEFVPGDD